METITIDDFKKMEIKIGKILSAEIVPESEKLILFKIDLGEENPRQILSGIRKYFPEPNILVGKSVPVIANLLPRKIIGYESNGMVLYAIQDSESGEKLTTLEPYGEIIPGSFVS